MSNSGRAMDLVLGGWQVTNTLTYGTGLPWTPSLQNCGQVSDAGPCRPKQGRWQLYTLGLTHQNGANILVSTRHLAPLSQQNAPEIALSPIDITGSNDCLARRLGLAPGHVSPLSPLADRIGK